MIPCPRTRLSAVSNREDENSIIHGDFSPRNYFRPGGVNGMATPTLSSVVCTFDGVNDDFKSEINAVCVSESEGGKKNVRIGVWPRCIMQRGVQFKFQPLAGYSITGRRDICHRDTGG